MDNKFSTIKDRCLQLAKEKGFSLDEFCSKIGMTYGNFKGVAKKTPLNSNAIENILTIIPDVNLIWLLTGRGSMLRDERPAQAPAQAAVPTIIYKSDPKDLKIIALQEDKIKTLEEKIKILEEKPSSQPQVLATSRSVDTITITGTQSTHK